MQKGDYVLHAKKGHNWLPAENSPIPRQDLLILTLFIFKSKIKPE